MAHRHGAERRPVAHGGADVQKDRIEVSIWAYLRKAADVAEDGITSVFPAGFVHLPQVDGEFLQQLCAEQLVTRRNRNGFAIREWHKLRERNEALDCYVYARAAAAAAGLDRFDETHWREMERQIRSAPELKPNRQERTENLMTTEATRQPRRLIRSHWLGG
jgi:phage terminase large subunit GpA-like protein